MSNITHKSGQGQVVICRNHAPRRVRHTNDVSLVTCKTCLKMLAKDAAEAQAVFAKRGVQLHQCGKCGEHKPAGWMVTQNLCGECSGSQRRVCVRQGLTSRVEIGDTLTDFRGDKAVIAGFIPPKAAHQSGRVIVEGGATYYAAVYDLEFITQGEFEARFARSFTAALSTDATSEMQGG